MDEEWRTILQATDYEVSDCGRVRRRIDSTPGRTGRTVKKGFMFKQYIRPDGYKSVSLKNNKKSKTYTVHRLVLKAFVGSCGKGVTCNHKNGVKADNRLSNLEWVTYSENHIHAYKLGLKTPTVLKGEQNGFSKLKDGEVWLIKKLLASDMYKEKTRRLTQGKIGKMFDVCPTTISAIEKEKIWSHIKYEENNAK